MKLERSLNEEIFDNNITEEEWDSLEELAVNRQKKYATLLAFSITNQCPLKCDHCVVDASSVKEIDEMPIDKFKDLVLQLSDLKGIVEQISITGGEPFVKPEKIKFLSDHACKNGIKVGVVTSAFWARTPEIAQATVDEFSNLYAYAISTDVYHIKYVPLHFIKNAYFAAKNRNKRISIRIAQRYNPSEKEEHILKYVQSFVEDEREITIQNLIPFGRAKKYIQDAGYPWIDKVSCIPCFSNAPVICENGIVEPCCGALLELKDQHPMVLGNVYEDSLKQIYNNIQYNALFHYIRLWGLKDLVSLIENSELKYRLPKHYIQNDPCTACCYLFSDVYISKFLNELSKTLAFRFKVAAGMSYYLDDDKMLNSIEMELKHSNNILKK